MSKRIAQPWNLIHEEVDRAVIATTKTDFVTTSIVAKHVIEFSHLYPHLSSTMKCTKARITMSMLKRGWVLWSTNNPCGSGKRVFIIPKELRV